MDRTRTAARVGAGIGALLVTGVIVASCALAAADPSSAPTPSAPPTPTTAPATPEASSQTIPDASPTPTATGQTPVVTTDDEPWQYELPDGTMRLTLPAGWTAAETQFEQAEDNVQLESIRVVFTSPSGTELTFNNRSGDDAALEWRDFAVVEQRETPSGLQAIAYWGDFGYGITAGVVFGGLTAADAPYGTPVDEDTMRQFMLMLDGESVGAPESFDSVAEAEEFLAGSAAQEALDVIETVELL